MKLQELSASNVPTTVSQEWQWDLQTASKGIVEHKKLPQKKSKPELVLDEHEFY